MSVYLARAALLRSLEAQQPHEVRAVRVERLRRARGVQPHGRVRRVVPQILHVPQHMPLGILRARPAHVRAQAAGA